MARKRKQLTVEQHEELAVRLNLAASELQKVLRVVHEAYGVSNEAAKILEKLVFTGGKIDSIRSYLDSRLWEEHPPRIDNAPYFGESTKIRFNNK